MSTAPVRLGGAVALVASLGCVGGESAMRLVAVGLDTVRVSVSVGLRRCAGDHGYLVEGTALEAGVLVLVPGDSLAAGQHAVGPGMGETRVAFRGPRRGAALVLRADSGTVTIGRGPRGFRFRLAVSGYDPVSATRFRLTGDAGPLAVDPGTALCAPEAGGGSTVRR